jgi:hypothetical protein
MSIDYNEIAGIKNGLNHKPRRLKLGLAAGLWYDEGISPPQAYLNFIMAKFIDLTGRVFGKLTVIDRAENGSQGRIRWNCSCECGGSAVVRSHALNTGHTKSCNCLMRETNSRAATALMTTHGASTGKTSKKKKWAEIPREYRVWVSMKDRVKRNVFVCPEWVNSYETFLADMGEAPSGKHQIDRINNSQGYCPDNCRWVTPKENARNKTNNSLVEWRGEVKCIAEWEEILCPSLGLKSCALHVRINHYGWSVEKAFTTPNQCAGASR